MTRQDRQHDEQEPIPRREPRSFRQKLLIGIGILAAIEGLAVLFYFLLTRT
ncbi:hypothetical protein GF1_02230 [Desulfolithobacter dissulfuricans]|uniref:Uncharacterized protein n=1 Tax=Desulfolithobacter dissulfuricans TaxID=2795293 RepID=A0A915TZW7_9BACT|nr:hypothetical protein [Desulfolithobacter dissulfuricans]BCO07847.1 hypothetical protein GF1_02230 [Desulfolithobacter dissulfuricans]